MRYLYVLMVELIPIEIVYAENEEILLETINPEICPVCLEVLSYRIWTCDQCRGNVHIKCIREWKKQHINFPHSYTCPLCNYTIKNSLFIHSDIFTQCLNVLLLALSLSLIAAIFYGVIILAAMLGWLLRRS